MLVCLCEEEWVGGTCVPDLLLSSPPLFSPLLPPLSSLPSTHKVACGVAHLHQHHIVYYDLKSSNILVFQFPTAQESLQVRGSWETVRGEG